MTKNAPEGFEPWVFDSSDPMYVANIEGLENRRLFTTYVGEALFFWTFMKPLIEQREPARALEVGAGVGLLSLFAATEIESVTSLEPESSGFEIMSTFRKVILDAWTGNTKPEFKECFLEELADEASFDLIYCINVLEHVPEYESLLQEIYNRLSPGGMAWFVMPNYAFPWEQHFNLPIVLNKKVTEKIFWRRIHNQETSRNREGLWTELSWPTQRAVKKFLESSGWSHKFHKAVFGGYFKRLSEANFISRKGALLKFLLPLIKLLKPAITRLPLRVLPLVEFTLSKPAAQS